MKTRTKKRKSKNISRTSAHVSRSVRQPMPKDKLVKLSPEQKKACRLCGRKEISETLYGYLYQLNDVVVHHYCILFSTTEQNGDDDKGILGFLLQDIKTELKKASKKICFYCHKKGASISCCSNNCGKKFHLPCGLENGSMHQYFGDFKSFCQEHREIKKKDQERKTKKEKREKKCLKNSTPIECTICTDDLIPNNVLTSLWAPCCKQQNGWFHRICIQQLAINAGFDFKCPLCNNNGKFKQKMLDLGIFIPSRNALWDTEPEAYAELEERHSSCDMEECKCKLPGERKFKNETGPWEIVLCYTCGSNGTHVECSSLECDQQWICKTCSPKMLI